MTASPKTTAIETAWHQVGYVLNRKDLSKVERDLIEQAQELMRQAALEADLAEEHDE